MHKPAGRIGGNHCLITWSVSPSRVFSECHRVEVHSMKDEARSKKSLIRELDALRRRVAELEHSFVEERELAEDALSEAELRYEKLTEASPDGVVITEGGFIVDADERIAEISRRDPSDLLGMKFEELIPDDGDSNQGTAHESPEKGPVELDLIRKDGTRIPVSISTEALSESAAAAVAVVRDLTQEKEAEKEAAEQDERFRAVFEASTDAIYLKDSSLRLTHVNPAMEKLFGRSASELLAASPEELYGKRAANSIRRWDSRALSGEVIQNERAQEVDGEPRVFLENRVPLSDANDNIWGVCCISRDITDYRREVPRSVPGAQAYPSKSMRSILELAEKIAVTDGTVLLLGESGSGKDHLAQWIHDHSKRSSGPYFTINCAALSPELAESELFGHEAGSFTGARGRKKGMLELAEGGTLLLNEIGELPLLLQSKLLTFLDSMSFMRVGGERSVTVDARLMAATHRDLSEEVAKGDFLEPLYYRLNVFTLNVPPLRERLEDLSILVDQILAELAHRMNLTKIPRVDPSMIAGLSAYNWPGNVRELKNTLERALMLWDGGPLDLKLPTAAKSEGQWSHDLPFSSDWGLRQVTDEITKGMCIEALRRTDGNKKEAAQILRISRDALYRYIRRFNINPEMLS